MFTRGRGITRAGDAFREVKLRRPHITLGATVHRLDREKISRYRKRSLRVLQCFLECAAFAFCISGLQQRQL